jgi:hypothetical protein
MQIILLEKVANLGSLGDVVRVKDGYARNFLIPTGQARRATANAVKEFEVRRAELERPLLRSWPPLKPWARSCLARPSPSPKRLASMAACLAP